MGITYDMGDGSYSPPVVLDPPEKKKKVYKKRKDKSPVDILVEEITEKKRTADYTIVEPTMEQYETLKAQKIKEWEEHEEIHPEYEDDMYLYLLFHSIMFVFEHEQAQKQVYYGMSGEQRKIRDKTAMVYSIAYDHFMPVEERIRDGYFTIEEKQEIAKLSEPLWKSIYRKYVPGDNVEVGPYDKEDILEAVYFGMTKALNSYVTLSGKMKASFTSWAYTCMNNACKDVVLSYTYGKRKGFKKVSIDEQRSGAGQSNDGGNEDKSLENLLSSNLPDEIEEFVNNLGRKELLDKLFDNMYHFDAVKIIDREIFVLRAFFGILSGTPMTMVQVSQALNMDIKDTRKVFNSAKEHMVQSASRLGFSNEDIIEFLG